MPPHDPLAGPRPKAIPSASPPTARRTMPSPNSSATVIPSHHQAVEAAGGFRAKPFPRIDEEQRGDII